MSTCPCRPTTESTNPVMAPRSVTSTTLVINRSPIAAATRVRSRSPSPATSNGTQTAAPSPSSRLVTALPSAPAPPVTMATRCASAVMSLGARDRHDGRALDVLVAHLADLEVPEVVAELPESLLERGERLAGTRQRRGAGQHVVLHVGMIDAALLDLRHDDGQGLVGRPDERRPLLALLEAFRQR